MNTKQLISRITAVQFSGYGHHKVTILHRGGRFSHVTTNTTAIDRLNSDEPKGRNIYGYTLKQAAKSLYNEVKRNNCLK